MEYLVITIFVLATLVVLSLRAIIFFHSITAARSIHAETSLVYQSPPVVRRQARINQLTLGQLAAPLFFGAVLVGGLGLSVAEVAVAAPEQSAVLLNHQSTTPFAKPLAQQQTVTGTVFVDINANGVRDTADTTGVASVTVTAYDVAGSVVATDTTDLDGNYSLLLTPPVRLEFTTIADIYEPGPAGPDSGTTVVFFNPDDSGPIDVGLVNPADYCQDNPLLVTSCYVFDGVLQTNVLSDAVISFPYDAGSDDIVSPLGPFPTRFDIPITHDISIPAGQVGTTYGIAYQRSTGRIFAAAYMHRHAGLGPGATVDPDDDPGAIYVIEAAGGGASSAAVFTTIDAGPNLHGTTFLTDYLEIPSGPVTNTWQAAGKTAFGDLDISEDEQFLYAVNLFDRRLYQIDLSGATPTASTPVPTGLPGATQGCLEADVRPFGLGIQDEVVYLGMVCSAETSQQAGDLRAYVYTFDPNSGLFATAPALEFSLDPAVFTSRGACAFRSGNSCDPVSSGGNNMTADWRPWAPTFVANPRASTFFPNEFLTSYPQPMLSDIDFDNNGHMLLGFRDRYGSQVGFRAPSDPGEANDINPTLYLSIVAGDILRACRVGDGWVAPGSTGCPDVFEDNYSTIHDEISLGGLAHLPGKPDTPLTVYDAFPGPDEVNDGGVRWFETFDLQNGAPVRAYRLYNSDVDLNAPPPGTTFGKGNGLGDLEALCSLAPIEVGNRVWLDQNNNGIQDPGEAPLGNVIVELAKDGAVLGSATTDVEGTYYFIDITNPISPSRESLANYGVVDGLGPNMGYEIRVALTQTSVASYTLTQPNATGDVSNDNKTDLTDSDAIQVDSTAVISFSTSGPGHNNHTLDVGLQGVFDLALIKRLADDQAATITAPAEVTYVITVYNQGTVTASNIALIDYLPAGFALADGSWTDGGGTATQELTGVVLGPGETVTRSLVLSVSELVASGVYTNFAEVLTATDEAGTPVEDVDSTPDNDVNNDNFVRDDEINEDGKEGGDEDDHDPAFVTVEDVFDLALVKRLADDQAATITAPAEVTYVITVYNQGTVTASNIALIDYLPANFVLADGSWSDGGNTATQELTGVVLAPGETVTRSLVLSVSELVASGVYTNFAEVLTATDEAGTPVEDVDSTPDNDVNNDNFVRDDEINEDGKEGGDEDDHDPAFVTVEDVFDLALVKRLADDQAATITAPAEVTYVITVYNQGTVTASNIALIDYLPAGFALADGSWSDGGNTATQELTGVVLGPGETVTRSLVLSVSELVASGVYTNFAEVLTATDEAGTPVEDVDSTPDNDVNNDNFVRDDEINEDGKEGGDEDDHDPAFVTVEDVFDLALVKRLADDQAATITAPAEVTYVITVYNQGTVTASNIALIDYLPAGFALADGSWSDGGNTATQVLTDVVLAPGETVTRSLVLSVSELVASGTYTNFAEVLTATDEAGTPVEDVDSTPDNDVNNDNFVRDDEINEDGKEGGDEDDHDPAFVTVEDVFDLALVKRLADDQAATITAPAEVTYVITVYNQGTVTASNIALIDYLPAGFALADGSWSDGGNTATQELTGVVLGPGETVTRSLVLSVSELVASGVYTNFAEVLTATDEAGTPVEDVDSTPDNDVNNDNFVRDDEINEDGKEGGDEDDHDPAFVTVEDVFDLALVKRLADDQAATITAPAEVTYVITVYNQGTVTASNIALIDYLPAGFALADGSWTDGGGTATQELTGVVLGPGETVTRSLVLSVSELVASGVYTNFAEVLTATDEAGTPVEDVDSTPDNDVNNDNFVRDDEINEDGKEGGDEDDHDPAFVTVEDVFDLALVKRLADDQAATIAAPAEVTYVITVYNQGTVTASNIALIDYLPAGFALADGSWSDGGNTATQVLTDVVLAPGETVTRSLVLSVSELVASGVYTNFAEVLTATDEAGTPVEDVDSTPDNDVNNDNFVRDDEINEDGKEGGDEDDHDPAFVTVEDVFDLALVKRLADDQAATITAPAEVTYVITVYNQGTVTASNIALIDYLPANFVLADGSWSDGGNTATQELTGVVLGPGETVTRSLVLSVSELVASGVYTNFAEVLTATDEAGTPVEDVDSTPDNDVNNDNFVRDDEINEDGKEGGDEDDHDPAFVTVEDVFDLALVKRLADDQAATITAPAEVTYVITVYNQGTVTASNIALIDYLPAGFALADGSWTDGGGTATQELTGVVLGPGETVTRSLVLSVSELVASGVYTNFAEVLTATDEAGTPVEDVDSTPDNDVNNDNFVRDDEINEDGKEGGDEDDHDPAFVTVEDVFDLALVKRLADDQAATITAPAEVTYVITVYNQGTVTASNIALIDYLPAGFALADGSWSDGGNTATQVLTDVVLGPGETVTRSLVLSVSELVASGTYTNFAEVLTATDEAGTPVEDVDSTPDNDVNNDNFVRDDEINEDGKEGGDEDDHDPAFVTVEDAQVPLRVGNLVWNDLNDNGLYEPSLGEAGIDGVLVELFLQPVTGDPVLVGTDTTTGGGFYLIEDLEAGTYFIRLPVSNFDEPSDPLFNFASSTPTFNPADGRDSDDNGADVPSGGIASSLFNLRPGEAPVGEVDEDGTFPDENSDLTIDFGVVQLLALGNEVWFDENDNGLLDPGEQSVPGVTVNLIDSTGQVIKTTTTDENGIYNFFGLRPGDYVVEIPTSNFLGNGPLSGNRSSAGWTNPNNDIDNDDNGIDSDDPASTGIRSEPVTLSYGDEPANDGFYNPTVDFGFVSRPTAIGLEYFKGSWQGSVIVLDWKTVFEDNNFGFEISRSETGNFDEAEVIASVAAKAQPDSDGTRTYSVEDKTAQTDKTYTYWLVDIEDDGDRTNPANDPDRTVTVSPPSTEGDDKENIYLPVIVR